MGMVRKGTGSEPEPKTVGCKLHFMLDREGSTHRDHASENARTVCFTLAASPLRCSFAAALFSRSLSVQSAPFIVKIRC